MDGQSLWNMPIATTRYPGFGIGKKVPLLGLDQINPTRHFRRGGPFGVPRGATKIPCFGRRDDGDGRMLFLANQTPFYVSKKLLSHESIESNCAPGELFILVARCRRVCILQVETLKRPILKYRRDDRGSLSLRL